MYYQAKLQTKNKTKTVNFLTNFEHLNINGDEELTFNIGDSGYNNIRLSIKHQLEKKLKENTFNGFLGHMAKGTLEQLLTLINTEGVTISLSIDKYNK